MKKIILSMLILCSFVQVWAQENERAFQLSFVPPLSTNGLDSYRYSNIVSLNLLGGVSYANTALELGGLFNVNTGYTQGAQFAGIFNYTAESRNNVQFAGITNIAKSSQDGSVLFAGIMNLSLDGTANAQFAGITNYANNLTGLQMSVINIAQSVKGVQFGLINYADEIEGVPIGLISIVKNGGKRELEVSFSEVLDTTLNFKLGTDHFYTIFSIGTRYINKPFEYAPGFGIGTQLNWAHGWSNQIEFLGYQVTEDTKFNKLNMLSQLKILTSKQLIGGLNVSVGPTLNVACSTIKDKSGNFDSTFVPWSFWEKTTDDVLVNMWVGFHASVSYRF